MTINEIWEDALIHFDEGSLGKYNSDGGIFGRRLVNRVYREVCREAKCGTRTSVNLTASTSTREIALPANLVALKRVLCKPDGYARGYQLKRLKETADFIDEKEGPPAHYYQDGTEYIGLVPFPDQAYVIPIICLIGPTAEVGGDQSPLLVPWDWQHVITFGTTHELFRIDNGDDGQGTIKWDGRYKNELGAFKRFRQEDCNADQYTGVE